MWIWTVLIVALVFFVVLVLAYPFLSKSYSNRALAQRRVKKLAAERERIYQRIVDGEASLGSAELETLKTKAAKILEKEDKIRQAMRGKRSAKSKNGTK